MRRVLVAMLLATTASPAFAAPRDPEDAEMARIANTLNEPRAQSAMAGVMIAMADIVIDLRVDTLRAAIARIDPDARDNPDWVGERTLGDVVARDDPHFREKLAESMQRTVGTAGAVASALGGMLPELRAIGERINRKLERFPTR